MNSDRKYSLNYGQMLKDMKAAPKVKEYWIPEGVEKIDRLAFHHCVFEDLHLPSTCRMEEWPSEEWPVFGNERIQGCIWPWEEPYSSSSGTKV